MKFDPAKLSALAVHLHGRQIGIITSLAGDRQLFAFEQDYLNDANRPTLGLSFKGRTQSIVSFVPPGSAVFFEPATGRTPAGLSGRKAGVNAEREFYLLSALPATASVSPTFAWTGVLDAFLSGLSYSGRSVLDQASPGFGISVYRPEVQMLGMRKLRML